ncbi:replication-associated recombination protein A [Paenisporosarcina sp. TG-14]|uniref:replication-associated recombination protein A n=1 Tax=Paenisporosarcina sp. TG-14 TaxID=1231057 RepID=UPI0002E04E04
MFRSEPLSYRMRPTTIDQVVGQEEIIGPNTALYKMIKNGHLPSMLLYGPPGTGKTSLAYAIAGTTKKDFYSINATISGKKDIESIIDEARMTRNAIIFVDEIHVFNRTQQDALLKALEEGVFTLIGATTENPYHSVNNAIRSRCGQIKQLKLLSTSAITTLLKNALKDEQNGLGKMKVIISESQIELIAQTTGDGRTALSLLENIIWATEEDEQNNIIVTDEIVKECVQNRGFTHDNKGDIYFNLLSSFQKSIRGSDVDAALYYLARLLEGGDLVSISRRLLVIAYEDIGLANPELCARVLSAIQSVDRIGLPEGRIPLSVITTELCLSPKSNTAYKALDNAIQEVKNGKSLDIPPHLKDSHYQGAAKLNGNEYKYPHNYPNNWVHQEYLPKEISGKAFYEPKETGEEKRFSLIHKKLVSLRKDNKLK